MARSYDQYCPVAAALDVVGDRWTLLIMRELVAGDLQAEGLVEHKELPPPAARTVYAASKLGRQLIPVLRSLARFGVARLGPPDDQLVEPQVAVYGMLTPFHRPEADGERFHARLEVDGTTFDVVTDGAHLSLRRRPDETPDAVIDVSARDLVAARQGLRQVLA